MATTKKPRNYGATESTLTQLRKTRRDIAALTKRVRSLEVIVLDLSADVRSLMPTMTERFRPMISVLPPTKKWLQLQSQRPQPKGKR